MKLPGWEDAVPFMVRAELSPVGQSFVLDRLEAVPNLRHAGMCCHKPIETAKTRDRETAAMVPRASEGTDQALAGELADLEAALARASPEHRPYIDRRIHDVRHQRVLLQLGSAPGIPPPDTPTAVDLDSFLRDFSERLRPPAYLETSPYAR